MCNSAVRCSATLCLLVAFVPLSAQVGRNGSITGEAFDPDHTHIAGATLTLLAPDGLTRKSLTAPDSSFSFPDPPSGSYTIQGRAQSFAPLALTTVPVAIGRTTSITLSFVLASTSESVSVTATPQALDFVPILHQNACCTHRNAACPALLRQTF